MFNNFFTQPNSINNPMNNPMMAQAMSIAQGKSPDELKKIALDMAKQKGMSQQDMEKFFGQFGVKL